MLSVTVLSSKMFLIKCSKYQKDLKSFAHHLGICQISIRKLKSSPVWKGRSCFYIRGIYLKVCLANFGIIIKISVPPTVTVRQREKQAERGTNVELRCDVTGSPTPAVRWTKDGGELPDQHRVQDGVLT